MAALIWQVGVKGDSLETRLMEDQQKSIFNLNLKKTKS